MLKLYDSYEKREREFKPLEKNRVVMYVCGLTPYDSAHIGHARTYVMFDLLKRYLLYLGYEVYHIQNITDVDDKLIKRAKETNKHIFAIADHYHHEAINLFDKLNILRADIYPRVSQYIHKILEMVEGLEKKGYAYETETGVYFEVDKFENYGKLSNQTKENLLKHRIEPDPTKKKPYDFALWKKEKDLIYWNSKYGEGRPGWHIECSAMSLDLAKRTLDIHGGGRDLIFPHHENEIAQSEAYTGEKFVNFWLHTGELRVEGVKMSKSLGNFITLKQAIEEYSPGALRMFFLTKKYSSPIDFNKEAVKEAREALNRIFNFYENILNTKEGENPFDIKEYKQGFFSSLNNDLDSPSALSHIFNLIREGNSKLARGGIKKEDREEIISFFKDFFFIFGLDKFYQEKKKKEQELAPLINLILKLREELRKRKEYQLTDKIREVLTKQGIEVRDEREGTTFRIEV